MGDYNSRYNRNNGADLYDNTEIENFRQQQAQDVIDNFMLGDFNSDGHYVVDKSIINELITTTKVITSTFDNFKFCQSTKKFEGIGNIQFAVDFSSNPENGQAVAVLVLLESMKACNGFIDNTNGVSIARFVGNNDKNFVERALMYFYVFLPDEIDGASFVENDRDIHFSNILSRLSYLRSVKNLVDPFVDKIELETYKKKSKILNEKQTGKEVFDDFTCETEGIKDKFLDKSKSDYYKMLNTLLDKALEKHERKIKEDKELDSSLKDIETDKRVNSKQVLDIGERKTVDFKLSQNAETIFNKKSFARNSKGNSPVAIYREPKKSYEEIENYENARYTVRDNNKEYAKSSGPKLFGRRKCKEPEISEKDVSTTEEGIPEKLSQKPSFLKNNRYEEIKNNELNGEKLSTNPSPYSKGNKVDRANREDYENRLSNENQKTNESQRTNGQVNSEEKEELLRSLLGRDKSSSKTNTLTNQENMEQKTQEQFVNKQGQKYTSSNQQTSQYSTQPSQSSTQSNQSYNKPSQSSTQVNQSQQNQYSSQQDGYGRVPPPYGPYDPRRPYGPNFYGPNPYGPYDPRRPYGPNPYGMNNEHDHDDGFVLESLFNNEHGPYNQFGPNPFMQQPMNNGPRPTAPTQEAPEQPSYSNSNEPTIGIPKPVGPINPVDDVTVVITNELNSIAPPHIDATPIISQEDIMKEIFGNDIYEFTSNEEKQRQQQLQQQQQKQKQNEGETDENAFVFVHTKH